MKDNIFRKRKCSRLMLTTATLIMIMLLVNNIQIVNYLFYRHQSKPNFENIYKDLNATEKHELFEINFPHIFESLPHLKSKQNHFKAKNVISKNKRDVSLVMGLSTIKRENITYLYRTLDTLFNGMNGQEKAQSLVVVLIAEVDSYF